MVPRNPNGAYPSLRGAGSCRGYIYTCCICGEQWAKLEIASEYSGFHLVNWPCRKHGTKYQLGGTILKPLIWWEFLSREKAIQKLPAELLNWEFNLLLELT